MRMVLRYVICVLTAVLISRNPARAASYRYESPSYCNGAAVLDWNGKSRYAFSTRVYDFSVHCGGKRWHIMDLFLASADPDRYQKRGATLYKHTGDQRETVKLRDRECTLVPETIEVSPPADNPCYSDILHPDCDPDKRYYATRMVKRCTRAQYSTRYVPRWEPFPTGYSPLPPGARIVKAAATTVVPARNSTDNSSDSNAGTIVGWSILGIVLVGGVAYAWKPVARFYYTAFVPHPAKKILDASIASNTALDTEAFERAINEAARGPFPDIMANKAAELRQILNEHTAMMQAVEERERARMRAMASAHFGKQIDKDLS